MNFREKPEPEPFKNARDFMNALRLSNERWLSQDGEWESRWLFRGQQNADWELIPRAWRQGDLDPFQEFKNKYRNDALSYFNELSPKYGGSVNDSFSYYERADNQLWVDVALQQVAELRAMQEFISVTNRLGHAIPDGETAHSHLKNKIILQDLLESPIEIIKEFVRKREFGFVNPNNSAYALAQHHGIPTRLLDWTNDALIAAFFAAEHVKPDDSYDIAVWGLRRDALNGSSLGVVDRPWADINYLNAQKGSFTYEKRGGSYFLKHEKWPHILATQKHESVLEPFQFEHGAVHQLTLPANECGELLRLLWIEGISRAHLMPTYDNVAIALQTRNRWR